MRFLKRLFKIGQAELHHAIDNIEDPIKMTEQGIRDLRDDLEKGLEALAQVKAMSIRARNESAEYALAAEDYKEKAMLILKKSQRGVLDAQEADRIATEALVKKEEAIAARERAEADRERIDRNAMQMEANVQMIRHNITRWESELKILRSRVKVADATKSLNKQLAKLDGNGTISLLERMKDKVMQEEALAEAYAELGFSQSPDREINQVADLKRDKASSELDMLKEQLRIGNPKST